MSCFYNEVQVIHADTAVQFADTHGDGYYRSIGYRLCRLRLFTPICVCLDFPHNPCVGEVACPPVRTNSPNLIYENRTSEMSVEYLTVAVSSCGYHR
jgi:hypothetical protein